MAVVLVVAVAPGGATTMAQDGRQGGILDWTNSRLPMTFKLFLVYFCLSCTIQMARDPEHVYYLICIAMQKSDGNTSPALYSIRRYRFVSTLIYVKDWSRSSKSSSSSSSSRNR